MVQEGDRFGSSLVILDTSLLIAEGLDVIIASTNDFSFNMQAEIKTAKPELRASSIVIETILHCRPHDAWLVRVLIVIHSGSMAPLR